MKIWGYITLFGLISACFSGVFYAGYTKASNTYQALIKEAELTAEIQKNQNQTAINSITTLWQEKEPEIEYKYKTIIKEVEVIVPDNRSCDVYADVIQLLSTASQGVQEGANTTQLVDTSARSSQGGIIRTAIKWAESYHALKRRNQALIEVVKIECNPD